MSGDLLQASWLERGVRTGILVFEKQLELFPRPAPTNGHPVRSCPG